MDDTLTDSSSTVSSCTDMALTPATELSSPSSSSYSSPAAKPPTGFLSMPLELRLQIYTYLLQLAPYTPHANRHDACTPHASILRTCRLINAEATPLLYALNTFIAHPSLLTTFPRLRPHLTPVSQPWPLGQIRRFQLTLRLDIDPPFTAAAAEAAFSGVEELTVYVTQSSFLGVGCANLRLLEGVRGVKSVRIAGSTTGFEEYVAWLEDAMRTECGTDVPKFVAQGPSVVDLLSIRFYV